jgi:hypothetical protein
MPTKQTYEMRNTNHNWNTEKLMDLATVTQWVAELDDRSDPEPIALWSWLRCPAPSLQSEQAKGGPASFPSYYCATSTILNPSSCSFSGLSWLRKHCKTPSPPLPTFVVSSILCTHTSHAAATCPNPLNHLTPLSDKHFLQPCSMPVW